MVVKGLRQPNREVIAEVARELAEEADQMAFREMLTEVLRHLHEGSIARYRLRRSEYIAWQNSLDQRPTDQDEDEYPHSVLSP